MLSMFASSIGRKLAIALHSCQFYINEATPATYCVKFHPISSSNDVCNVVAPAKHDFLISGIKKKKMHFWGTFLDENAFNDIVSTGAILMSNAKH